MSTSTEWEVGETAHARCIGSRGIYGLTESHVYAIEIVEGFFPDRPYAAYVDDNGRKATAYAWRFGWVEDE